MLPPRTIAGSHPGLAMKRSGHHTSLVDQQRLDQTLASAVDVLERVREGSASFNEYLGMLYGVATSHSTLNSSKRQCLSLSLSLSHLHLSFSP